MTGDRTRVGVGLAIAVLAAVLLLAAGLLLADGRPGGWNATAARPDPDDCGPISAGDQQALLWLSQLRKADGIPLSEISLPPCDAGTRNGATAFVDVGRSALVQDFFTTHYDCDVKRSCVVRTHDADFVVYLTLTTEADWSLTVASRDDS